MFVQMRLKWSPLLILTVLNIHSIAARASEANLSNWQMLEGKLLTARTNNIDGSDRLAQSCNAKIFVQQEQRQVQLEMVPSGPCTYAWVAAFDCDAGWTQCTYRSSDAKRSLTSTLTALDGTVFLSQVADTCAAGGGDGCIHRAYQSWAP